MSSDLRISGASPNSRSESDIRVSYHNTRKIIAASNDLGASSQAQFFSSDRGETWGQSSLPLALADAFHSDPAVDWTSDGTAWSITLGIQGFQVRLRAYRSADGGATWSFDSTPSGGQTNTDREIMWVDHSPGSPFRDQIYATWHAGVPAFVARRTTGAGAAWQAPLQVSGAETTGTAIGGDIKTNSAGDVFVFWPEDGGGQGIHVAKSVDGGASFGTPVTIATLYASHRQISIPADTVPHRLARVYISGGAYRTAAKDLVYAIWTDLSGQPGCTTGQGPGSNVSSACKSRIWFARSADGGATWSSPMKINDQPGKNDQFHSRLCVDETDGRLVVVYNDSVGDPGRLKTDIWMQHSSDDGVTWSPAVKVTSAQTDETVPGAQSFGYGDYLGLSGYAGTYFPCWTDRRSGGPEEIWTRRIVLRKPGHGCTGKISGVIYDHFGDFEGFVLEADHDHDDHHHSEHHYGQHHHERHQPGGHYHGDHHDHGDHHHEDCHRRFYSREKAMAELAHHAWQHRLRVTVYPSDTDPDRPHSITIHQPPAPYPS